MEESEETLGQTAESDKPDTASKYHVTEVPIQALTMDITPLGSVGAQAPRYDRESDEPAFEAAWKEVAELRAQGKIAPLPPFPQGGLKLRGPRQRTTE